MPSELDFGYEDAMRERDHQRMRNRYCSVCSYRGEHAQGCPERPDVESLDDNEGDEE